ncbi:hypothetical protein K2X05_06710 [bacterium]|nr:hypothetical protein [bacterium]
MKSRRHFTKNSLSLILASTVVAPLLSACGGGSDSSPAPAKDTTNGTNSCDDGANSVYINPGHNHSAVNLTAQQLLDRIEGNYILMGGSHSHNFTLLAADFDSLLNGQSLQKTDLEGHGHILQITC